MGAMYPIWGVYRSSGLIPEFMLAWSIHCGTSRVARVPAASMQTNASRTISNSKSRSRRSFFLGLSFAMLITIDRQANETGRAGESLFAVSGAFKPDPTVVSPQDSARNGKAKGGTATFEFRFTG